MHDFSVCVSACIEQHLQCFGSWGCCGSFFQQLQVMCGRCLHGSVISHKANPCGSSESQAALRSQTKTSMNVCVIRCLVVSMHIVGEPGTVMLVYWKCN